MYFWDGQQWADEPAQSPSQPSRARSRAAHLGQAILEGSLIAALTVGLVAGSTFAARGGHSGGGGSTITGPIMVVDNNGNDKPDRDDDITFAVSTTATKYPNVGLRCYQDGMWVYDAYVGYYDSYMFNPWFTLDSNYWEKGVTAKCDARLFYNDKRGRQKVLATMSFNVGG